MAMNTNPSRAKLTVGGSGFRQGESRPGEAPVGVQVAEARRLHHRIGKARRRRLSVPTAGTTLGVEVVPQRLLVEARLRLAGYIALGRPETRAVRSEHLVDQPDG